MRGAALLLAAALAAPSLDELWMEPPDLAARDLFHGPGGEALVPPDAVYRFLEEDTEGHSGGYEVEDGEGRTWDVKTGEEAQSETVVSRILWAIGYHQPVTYYVARWRMEGGPTDTPPPGRFRLESDHDTEGTWDWRTNPFADTPALRGLAVANLLLNNWDLDDSQNRIYEPEDPGPGPGRWYVVQDLGASLGRTRIFPGTRNDLPGFESQGFVREVKDGRVKLDSRYWRHRHLRRGLAVEDVAWTCRLLDRLSERQLDDAFRAAGYPEQARKRYVRKIREKIGEGLALTESP